MKLFKLFGLAALMALMAMAVFDAPATMAESTALCLQDPGEGAKEECPEGERVSHVHEETLGGAKAKILSSSLNVECDVLFLGDASEELASPLVLSGGFSYSNCNSNCTLTEETGPAALKVLKEGHELASVTYELLVHVVCNGFINCRYIGEGLKGHSLGPLLSEFETGDVRIMEQAIKKESGTLCPSTAKLDLVTMPLLIEVEVVTFEKYSTYIAG